MKQAVEKDKCWWLHLFKVPETVEPTETGSRMVITKGCRRGERNHYLEDAFSVSQEETVLRRLMRVKQQGECTRCPLAHPTDA